MTFSASDNAAESSQMTFCAVHHNVETGLKCNKCGRYMCVKCAIKTPVGYRCRECVYQQQSGFYNATLRDSIVVGMVSFVLGLAGAYIIPRAFLFGVILFSPIAGAFIGDLAWRVIGRRRGRYIWLAAALGIIAAALVVIGPQLASTLQTLASMQDAADMGEGLESVRQTVIVSYLIPQLLYVVLCAGSAAARLRVGK